MIKDVKGSLLAQELNVLFGQYYKWLYKRGFIERDIESFPYNRKVEFNSQPKTLGTSRDDYVRANERVTMMARLFKRVYVDDQGTYYEYGSFASLCFALWHRFGDPDEKGHFPVENPESLIEFFKREKQEIHGIATTTGRETDEYGNVLGTDNQKEVQETR